MFTLMATKDVAKSREEICNTCPHRTPHNLCGQCHCFIPMKVSFARASCPIGKWDAVNHGETVESKGI